MAAPTMFDDVDRFSPDDSPEEYMEGALGIFENDEEKLDWSDDVENDDWSDDGNVFPKPLMPAAEPCICGAPWDRYDDPNDDPPAMYVGIGACIGWFMGGSPENLSNGLFSRSMASFLFFLLFVDIFLFLVWMPSFFIVRGRLTWKERKLSVNRLVIQLTPFSTKYVYWYHVSDIPSRKTMYVFCQQLIYEGKQPPFVSYNTYLKYNSYFTGFCGIFLRLYD